MRWPDAFFSPDLKKMLFNAATFTVSVMSFMVTPLYLVPMDFSFSFYFLG